MGDQGGLPLLLLSFCYLRISVAMARSRHSLHRQTMAEAETQLGLPGEASSIWAAGPPSLSSIRGSLQEQSQQSLTVTRCKSV